MSHSMDVLTATEPHTETWLKQILCHVYSTTILENKVLYFFFKLCFRGSRHLTPCVEQFCSSVYTCHCSLKSLPKLISHASVSCP